MGLNVVTLPLLWMAALAVAATGVAVFVLRPLWRTAPDEPEPVDSQATARSVLRERRREIEAALAHLPADAPERRAALAEFASQATVELAEPSAGNPVATPRPSKRPALVAGLLAALIVLLPLGLYLIAGAPEAVDPALRPADRQAASLDGLVAELQARVATAPQDVEAWRMLGRAELARGRTDAARTAFEQALTLAPRDAQIKVDFADALAQSQGAVLEGRPIELVREALEQDPRNAKALALAGAYEVGRSDYPAAIALWQRLLEVLPAESPQASQIAGFIADLQAGRPPQIGVQAPTAAAGSATPPQPGQTAAQSPGALAGQIEVSQRLAGRVDPQATVFVVARTLDANDQPAGPPVAVLRARAIDLPLHFTLDDRHAMAPSARLSTVPEGMRVVVIARVSKTGQAAAQPGDLQGASPPVRAGVTDLRVLIDTVVE